MHAARPILRKNEPSTIRVPGNPLTGRRLPPGPRGRPIRTANPLPQARSSLPARFCAGRLAYATGDRRDQPVARSCPLGWR